MSRAEETVIEAASDRWWETWWRADYSWEGLAKHPWRGWSVTAAGKPVLRFKAPKNATRASLQDFWRAEANNLVIGPDGREWTVAHVPPSWRDGEPEKRAWSEEQFEDIEAALKRALARLPKNAFELQPMLASVSRRPPLLSTRQPSPAVRMGMSWPVPLTGVVVADLPSCVTELPMVQAVSAAFLEPLYINSEAKALDLRQSLFADLASFKAPIGDLRLGRCIFTGPVRIRGPRLGELRARSTTFFDTLVMDGVEVSDMFTFSFSKFHGEVSLHACAGKDLMFTSAAFSSRLNIDNIKLGRLFARRMKCSHEVSIKRAALRSISLDRACFEDDVNFENIKILKVASFQGADWKRDVFFNGSQFGRVDFYGANFGASAEFKQAIFKARMRFNRARFERTACFDGARFPARQRLFAGTFSEACFSGYTSFNGEDFSAFAAFDGAQTKAEVRFSPEVFQGRRGFLAAQKLATTDLRRIELENGLRVLKQAAESVRHKEAEQSFYAYQLMTRRVNSMVDTDQRWALAAYSWVSEYGRSFIKPLIGLVVTCALGTMAMLGVAVAVQEPRVAGMTLRIGPVHPAAVEAAQMSLRGTVGLLGTWSVRAPDDQNKIRDLEGALLSKAGASLAVRTIWTLQGFIGGVLLFLSALSIRRWFQIS